MLSEGLLAVYATHETSQSSRLNVITTREKVEADSRKQTGRRACLFWHPSRTTQRSANQMVSPYGRAYIPTRQFWCKMSE